jgi:hypothetical protein
VRDNLLRRYLVDCAPMPQPSQTPASERTNCSLSNQAVGLQRTRMLSEFDLQRRVIDAKPVMQLMASLRDE